MTKPTVVIIAGGKNSRFFPLNTTTHKGFLELGGKPLVVYTLESLIAQGFTSIILVVSKKDHAGAGLSGKIATHNLKANVTFVLQPEALGQGNALLEARKHFVGPCIVLSPYYYMAGELATKLWETYQQNESNCVFVGTKTDHPERYGMLQFDQDNPQRVIAVIEKATVEPPSSYKISSVYLFNQAFLDHLAGAPQEEYSLETAINSFAPQQYIRWIENHTPLPTLKYSWQLLDIASALWHSQVDFRTTNISPEAKISTTTIIDDTTGPVIVEAGAVLRDFSKIIGPCYIGANTLVGEYSLVRESFLENDVTVGVRTEIVRSILLPKATIHHSYLADSILGEGVKVGAGLITANKRFDRATIHTSVRDTRISTGSTRLGTIVGAYTAVGIGVRTMPGALIGANVVINPDETVSTTIPHGKSTSN